MSILALMLLFFIGILVFFFLIKIEWLVKTFRDIAKDRVGYTKLVQFILIFVLISVFLLIIVYYIRHPQKVDRIDIILTVVVGWLGAVIGSFFGDKSMDKLDIERKTNVSSLITKLKEKELIIQKSNLIIEKLFRKLVQKKNKRISKKK